MFDEDIEYLNSYYVEGYDSPCENEEEILYSNNGERLDADTWFARF